MVIGRSFCEDLTGRMNGQSNQSRGKKMYFHGNGLWGLLVLAADIWAIVNIFQSGRSTEAKVLWTLLVVILPVLGFIVWLVAGPKTAGNR